jgi:hypothetical protein
MSCARFLKPEIIETLEYSPVVFLQGLGKAVNLL